MANGFVSRHQLANPILLAPGMDVLLSASASNLGAGTTLRSDYQPTGGDGRAALGAFLNRSMSGGLSLASGGPPAVAMPPQQNPLTSQARDLLERAGFAACVQVLGRGVCEAVARLIGFPIPSNGTGVPASGMPPQNGGGMMGGGMMGGGGFNPAGLQGSPACPEGYTRVGDTCVRPGAAMPGGMPFTVPFTNGGGAPFGTAMVPMMVDQTVLKCPPRYVLASDNLCYHKSLLPKRARKWIPGPKPILSGGDSKALKRVAAIKNRVRKAASSAGFTCKKSGSARAPSSKRKR